MSWLLQIVSAKLCLRSAVCVTMCSNVLPASQPVSLPACVLASLCPCQPAPTGCYEFQCGVATTLVRTTKDLLLFVNMCLHFLTVRSVRKMLFVANFPEGCREGEKPILPSLEMFRYIYDFSRIFLQSVCVILRLDHCWFESCTTLR